MRYFTNEKDLPDDRKLESLLAQRKAPLSEEGMRTALMDLTLYLCGDVEYLAAVYLKETARETPEIKDIEKADMMEGTDGERYFPVFTSVDRFRSFRAELKKGESAVLLTKQDLLDFLNGNQKLAAAVANPMRDDLLLYRVQLSNMIAIAKQKTL
ncbi:MAG: SseB family protein [Bulleidia sp.]